jgi:hypothetical protein
MDRGGLYVSFLGRGQPLLADQTMLLRPGSYRLAMTLSGEGRESGGALGLALQCLGGGEIAALRAPPLGAAATTLELAFEIAPEGCPAQRLILRGEPGEYPQRVRAEIASISIQSDVAPVEAPDTISPPEDEEGRP